MDEILEKLGDRVEDVDEETFDLFSDPAALSDLGMLDPTAEVLDVQIGNHDFTITQSPGLLQSQRAGGTTGAAVWQSSVRFARWIADGTLSSPTTALANQGEGSVNAPFSCGLLDATSTVLELGAGVSGVVSAVLARRVGRIVVTDQEYCLRALRKNIEGHCATTQTTTVRSNALVRKKKAPDSRKSSDWMSKIDILPLDWEADDVHSLLVSNRCLKGVDLLVACDCIYNQHLIRSFTQTCVDVCAEREAHGDGAQRATVCVIVQHLRQSEIFEEWLDEFMKHFHVFRLPRSVVGENLGERSGFVVHAAYLKGK